MLRLLPGNCMRREAREGRAETAGEGTRQDLTQYCLFRFISTSFAPTEGATAHDRRAVHRHMHWRTSVVAGIGRVAPFEHALVLLAFGSRGTQLRADFQQLPKPALVLYRSFWGERLPTRGAF